MFAFAPVLHTNIGMYRVASSYPYCVFCYDHVGIKRLPPSISCVLQGANEEDTQFLKKVMTKSVLSNETYFPIVFPGRHSAMKYFAQLLKL